MITPRMGIDPRFIYIATDGEFFKIGITKNILTRQRTLLSQFGKVCYIVCIASAKNGIARDVERVAKDKLKLFNHPYIYTNGSISKEWFDCDFDKIHNELKPLCNEILLVST